MLMNTQDADLEKLIWLVDANRVGLEKLRSELQGLKAALESQGLTTEFRRRASGTSIARELPPAERIPKPGTA